MNAAVHCVDAASRAAPSSLWHRSRWTSWNDDEAAAAAAVTRDGRHGTAPSLRRVGLSTVKHVVAHVVEHVIRT